jgi:hypothetical protein
MSERHEHRRQWTMWHLVAALLAIAAGMYATRNAWADMFHIAMVDQSGVAWFVYHAISAHEATLAAGWHVRPASWGQDI